MKFGIKKNKLKPYDNENILKKEKREFLLVSSTDTADTKKSLFKIIFIKIKTLTIMSPEKYFIKFQNEIIDSFYSRILTLPMDTNFANEIEIINSMADDVDAKHHLKRWKDDEYWQVYLPYHNARKDLIELSVKYKREHHAQGNVDTAKKAMGKLNTLTLKSLNAHTTSIKKNIKKAIKQIPAIEDSESLSNFLKFHMEILWHMGKNFSFASPHGVIYHNDRPYEYWDIMSGKSEQYLFAPICYAYHDALEVFYQLVEKHLNHYAMTIQHDMDSTTQIITNAYLGKINFNLARYQSLLDSYEKIIPACRLDSFLDSNNHENKTARVLESLADKITLQAINHINEYNETSEPFQSTLNAVAKLKLMFEDPDYQCDQAIFNKSLANISKVAISKHQSLLREIGTIPKNNLIEQIKNFLSFNKILIDNKIKMESPFKIMVNIFDKLIIRADVDPMLMGEIKNLFNAFNQEAAIEMNAKIYPLAALLNVPNETVLNLEVIANANAQNITSLNPEQEMIIRHILSNYNHFKSINLAGLKPSEQFTNYLTENRIKIYVRNHAILTTRQSNNNIHVLEDNTQSSWFCFPWFQKKSSATQNRLTHTFERTAEHEQKSGVRKYLANCIKLR